jgi:hypothetical protein
MTATPPNGSANPPTYTLEEWLALTQSEVAAYIAPRQLSVMFSIDGTRRHYLLEQAASSNIQDFKDYVQHSSSAYVKVFGLLFGYGIKTILTSVLYPLNFQRDAHYLEAGVKLSAYFLSHPIFSDFYKQFEVKARLYGDYEFAPAAHSVCATLKSINTTLSELTPQGTRQVLFGYNAGTFADEAIWHSVNLYQQLGRIPTATEVRAACFPYGPAKLDMLIGAGWLRVGAILPPLLDAGSTDIYTLNHLTLDLQELTLRRILYDHLFQRWAAPEDDGDYTEADLDTFRDYYRVHQNCLVGLGHLVGPGFWYPDHTHAPADSAQ